MDSKRAMEGNGLVTGLIGSTAPRLPRLSEVLVPSDSKRFDTIAALPSNVHAIESTQLFASRRASFVALFGPSGWGKSHLLESASKCLRSEFLESSCVLEATAWAASSARRDPALPLILDNVQDVWDKGRVRTQLRLALERRVRAGRPTLLSFTAAKQTRSVRSLLPNYKDWIVSGIDSPVPAEKELVVSHMSRAAGLELSESLIWLLGHRVQGNGRTLLGALKRLRLEQTSWKEPGMTLRACGVLDPFFADNSAWDLREHILACSESYDTAIEPAKRGEIAIFTMLRIALLSESQVARFLDIEPATAYGRALALESEMRAEGAFGMNSEVARFVRFTEAKLRA